MHTTIETTHDTFEVKESYATVKNRLNNQMDFMEVTTEKGKKTISKEIIAVVSPIVKKKK